MRKTMVALILALSILSIIGAPVQAGEKKVKIGLCMASLDTFLSSLADAAVRRANEKGVELVVMDAMDDTVRQADQVQNFITDGVDAIIINVVETSSAPPIVEMAASANIPLVWVNRNPFYTSGVVPANNYAVVSNSLREGSVGMEYAGEHMGGKGNIVILMGMLGQESTLKRTQGVKDVIAEKYPDIKVLDEQTGNWFRDQGMIVMENMITAYGDQINAVLSNNDEMALGAVLALQQYGMTDVILCGVDGTVDGIASVASGTGINATAYQDPIAQGAGSVDTVLRVLAGEKVDALANLPVDLVTRENVEEFQERLRTR